MIRLFLILSIILLIIIDGKIIISYLKYKRERVLLKKKSLLDKTTALVSIMFLLSSFLLIAIFYLKMIPLTIIYIVLIHLFIVLNIFIYYFAKYMDKKIFKNKFNSSNQTNIKTGKLKGREVSVKRKF